MADNPERPMSSNTTIPGTTSINIVGTWASLIGGTSLTDCRTPEGYPCSGGVAAVAAYLRYYSNGEPSLVVPRADRYTPFVQMHPLGWNVNRLVLNELLGWKLFASTPSLLAQSDEVSKRDLSDLQTEDMPLVLTNVGVPPSNSWYSYTKAVYFDDDTSLAVLSVADSDQPYTISQIETTLAILDYVAKVNMESGCTESTSEYYVYLNRTFDAAERRCWLPVVYYADIKERFDAFLAAVIEHENPPALIVDIEANEPAFGTPKQVGSKGVWLVSYRINTSTYYQHRLILSENKRTVANVELTTKDLEALPPELNDDRYISDVQTIRHLADEAVANDPVIGNSTAVPVARVGDYRRCKAGECEIGNLFTDALRWFAGADVAFITSGGLRGSGWPAGEIRVSNLWEALPFPNLMCNGTMSGVSLFKLFNYSTATATFQAADTSLGGRLLQVSGLRVTYNTQLEGSRLIALDIWNQTQGKYVPVERLMMYRFATDSYLCSANDPYPLLTGGDFTIDGEVPGVIGDNLHQDIVGEYLASLSTSYNASIESRLLNDTTAWEAMNLIQIKGECRAGTYWLTRKQTCVDCPDVSAVSFSAEKVDLKAESGSAETVGSKIQLSNDEPFSVSVSLSRSPSWVSFTETSLNSTIAVDVVGNAKSTLLQPGERLHLKFFVDSSELEAGTALGTVAFSVSDGGSHPGCVGQGATFDIFMRVTPREEQNLLGSIRFVAWSLAFLAILTAVFFGGWVYWNRHLRIVKTLQPTFLMTICLGVLIMAAGIFPLSVDDSTSSLHGCDIACMATPWLFSIGFTITFSALFSKLWRINKLFHNQRFRRLKVQEKDVIVPFAVVFALNFAILLSWTLVDPLRWTRQMINDQKWNTYGSCQVSGTAGNVFMALTAAVSICALFLACWQAYKARNISDEFSESKYLAIAIFSWVQLFIVGFPVLFLIHSEDVASKFFLQISLLFAVCMSMLLFIFVPMLIQLRKLNKRNKQEVQSSVGANVHVSGLNEGFQMGSTGAYIKSKSWEAENVDSRQHWPTGTSLESVDEGAVLSQSKTIDSGEVVWGADILNVGGGDEESNDDEIDFEATPEQHKVSSEDCSVEQEDVGTNLRDEADKTAVLREHLKTPETREQKWTRESKEQKRLLEEEERERKNKDDE